MAGSTPEEAVDAFLDRVWLTLDCLANCSVHRSPPAEERYAITAFERATGEQNLLTLITHDGTGEVLFRFSHLYRVMHVPDDDEHGQYRVRTLAYHYRILDVADREIALYHWHPDGSGPVTTPHLHVPAAAPIQMAQPFTSSRQDEKTQIGKMHFPTARIYLDDVAELLIRDFTVVPNRDDWQDILHDNREAMVSSRTW